MFVELIGSLRCVQPHEPGWLIAASERSEGRHIVLGVLGCPICHAEYPIVDGVADFTAGASETSTAALHRAPSPGDADEGVVMRAAALLDLTGPGGIVVLAGEWSTSARPLLSLVDGVHIVALNPVPGLRSGAGVSVVTAHDDLPLRDGVARGIALDTSHRSARYVVAALAALRAGGRLIAPADAEVPEGIDELARDSEHWVGTARQRRSNVVRLMRGTGVRGA